MLIKYGFDIEMEFSQPSSLLTLMDVHPDRSKTVVERIPFTATPARSVRCFVDGFGNLCRRVEVSQGRVAFALEGVAQDPGGVDPVNCSAKALPVEEIPPDVLPFLLASRYCETDLLSGWAWTRFGGLEAGWKMVQAICDYVHQHLTFDYNAARSSRSAKEALDERVGVCRDFAHLAITLCRCLNIPARYCNGYLGDIGVPPDPAPMDFNAWFEVYLDHCWYTFDARHNQPRIGRLLIARGRDAVDAAMITSFGRHALTRFVVFTEELQHAPVISAA